LDFFPLIYYNRSQVIAGHTRLSHLRSTDCLRF
jgi:hypothetical protein